MLGTALANESPMELQEAFMTAVRSNDADGLAACYSKDAVSFAIDDMVGEGPDYVRTSWQGFFDAYRVIDIELSSDHMETLSDTAVAWGLFTMTAEPVAGGEAVVMQGRYMDVSKNIDGQWLYIADHASMPIPAESEE
jgi:uncharacterized protein (TIGR02246 family)